MQLPSNCSDCIEIPNCCPCTKIESQVIVEAEGYEAQAKLVEVGEPNHGPAQRLDFDLAPMQVSQSHHNDKDKDEDPGSCL